MMDFIFLLRKCPSVLVGTTSRYYDFVELETGALTAV